MSRTFLILNAGSSSLKIAVFTEEGERRFSASATELGGKARLHVRGGVRKRYLAGHGDALAELVSEIEKSGIEKRTIAAAAHRVVHGGPELTESLPIDAGVLATLERASALAPLHNPAALAVIDTVGGLLKGVPQIACFDTAFHITNPELARRYALPDIPETEGFLRYGFHGLSYASLVARFSAVTGKNLPPRLLALHLGNGSSLCAIRHGSSVATTMGYSPLSGLTMGSRAGDIDGNAVLELARRAGLKRAGEILNSESGLRGLAGASDMRAIENREDQQATFALKHFVYWAIRHSGSMIAAMGGCDALAFTGGIGENSASIRLEIMDGLAFMGLEHDPDRNKIGSTQLHRAGSLVRAYLIPAQEEYWMAREAARIASPRPLSPRVSHSPAIFE